MPQPPGGSAGNSSTTDPFGPLTVRVQAEVAESGIVYSNIKMCASHVVLQATERSKSPKAEKKWQRCKK
jgi:hypothetical protein